MTDPATSPTPALEEPSPGLAVIRFDDPDRKVNTLTEAVLRRLEAILVELEGRDDLERVVLASGKPGVFIAGADVEEIAGVTTAAEGTAAARAGQAVFARLAGLRPLTVAALSGTCLGGGLEMALACDMRVAADDPAVSLGLPEVRLGIVPGFGGTQRLPRLVGLRKAVEVAVAGRNLGARQALAARLVDAVVPGDSLEEEAATRPPGRRGLPLADRLLGANRWLRGLVLRKVRQKTARFAPEDLLPAPVRALDLIDASFRLPLEQGLELEAEALGECLVTEGSRSLVGIFLGRADLRKRAASWRGASPAPVDDVTVIGAGIMGAGIAGAAIDAGCRVLLRDLDAAALDAGVQRVEAGLAKRVDRGRLSRDEAARRRERLATDEARLSETDVLVEAIVERLDVKRSLFAAMEEVLSPDAVLATNTSSLSVTAMAEELTHPGRVVGLHFFNPVHRMPLVEVIPGDRSDPQAVATAAELARRMGKVPVVVRDRPGFLVNRILMPYIGEALRLVSEGASFETVDRAARRFGMPMGPVALLDQIGLDVARHAAETMREAFGERVGAPDLLSRMVDAGRLGAKSGGGFYTADGKTPAPEATALIDGYGGARPGADVVRDRLVLALLGESVRALDEGIVERPVDVDMGMVMGTGFPPYRGGPLRYADHRGLPEIVETMERLAAGHGPQLDPPARLREMARSGEKFYL